MAALNQYTHLTHAERQIIETGINNGSTKKSIADMIGKYKSTVGKEVKEQDILPPSRLFRNNAINIPTIKSVKLR